MSDEFKGWGVFRRGQDVDISPINDVKEHVAGKDCHCKPTVKVDGASIIVIHNSYDFREINEELNGVTN